MIASSADVVVIGGGAIGVATAYELSLRGVNVVLLEQDGLARGASGRNHGFLWLHTRYPGTSLNLCLASAQRYLTLQDEIAFDFEMRRCGGLVTATSESEVEILREFVEQRRALSLDFQLLTGDEARRLEPELSPDILAASYFADDCHVYPFLLVAGLAKAARSHGAKILTGCRVEQIVARSGRVKGVRHSTGTIRADCVVLAAGAWSPLVAKTADVELPIVPTRLEMMVTVPMSRRVNAVVEDPLAIANYPVFRRCQSWRRDKIVANPVEDRGKRFTLLVAQANSGPVIIGETSDRVGYRADVTPTSIRAVAQRGQLLFPFLSKVPVVRTWAGWLPTTPDDLPLIGRVPGIDGLVLATGHNGYGIMLTPVSGVLAADAVTGTSNPMLDTIRPDRTFTELAGPF
ncbi:MAG: NAD(P)/FAD-dependent oxidoreductase [Thermomicrobiales bacterium]